MQFIIISVKKSIAIVGATERRGKEIAINLIDSNYRLLLISNNKNEFDNLSKIISDKRPKAGISFMECAKDGCWEADVIILAVAKDEVKPLAKMIKEVATQKIVIGISNEENTSKEIRKILPYPKLVKISGDFKLKEIAIRGEDKAVNEEVGEIFNDSGYHYTSKSFSKNNTETKQRLHKKQFKN